MFKIFRQRRISLGLKKSGFTLIEMLMVISLVSLLASIVMANIGNATDKAKIASTQQFAASVSGQLRDNIVAIWNFNDTNDPGKDSWKGKNDGILTCVGLGEICITDSANSSMGKALRLNGNDFVSIPAARGSLDIDVNPVTLEAWIKPNSVASGYKEIVGRGTTGTADGNGYGINLNGDKINLGVHGGGNFNSATALATGNWYHIVGVIKGANSKIYINGVADNNTGTINVVSSASNGSIGASNVGTRYFFNGLIDEVHIYNATLTAQEVQQRYAESAPRHGMAIK